jgi:hypothetical protein
MNEFWERELTEEEVEQLIERATAEVTKRRMAVPAVVFLEMHKPVANVAAHAALAFAPFLVPLFGFDFVNDYSRLITKRDHVERLIQRIEEAAKAPPKEDAA